MNLDEWSQRGDRVPVGDDSVFVVDTPAAERTDAAPLLVIHGFPTSSVDWAPVLPQLSARRRVVLFDLPGFGLSSKHDRPYGIASAADATAGVLEQTGRREFDLITHDMGDTVGGELLARDMAGELTVDGKAVRIRHRILTNGSIYLDMAQLTDAQHMLWSAADAKLSAEIGPSAEQLAVSLRETMAPQGTPTSNPGPEELLAAAESICHDEGALLLPRLIRYLSDRRDNEERFTGAIENHPSPLSIVWGELDPIAVVAMAHKLAQRRTDAGLTVLEGVGHYPTIEAPGAFSAAVLGHLDD